MKVAVIYNRESQKVINLFGVPNREKYGLAAIRRIVNSLKKGGHQAIALEGDKDLIDNLEDFMPRVIKGEHPGMAFNLSYGIQGQARYTHVPGILEMVGIPYVGSGPLAHSLALDKVVAKMLFKQNGLPTPDFAVLTEPGFDMPNLEYPLIVKPKNEAVSFGIRIVNSEGELREAADVIFQEFEQPVLVERYIEGREINVGVLGNSPPEAFEPAELIFGDEGPRIYTLEDKKRQSGREIGVVCPAEISPEIAVEAKRIAIGAFKTLGCYDCARVDIRMDDDGNLYILEVNSLPSLGEHGSYVAAADAMGMDFAALVNRMVEVASARYFGTPLPPTIGRRRVSADQGVFNHLVQRRDRLEREVREWVKLSSRSNDPVGIRLAAKTVDETYGELGLVPVEDLTDGHDAWAWETPKGLDGGTLLIGHLDVPVNPELGAEPFRRDPEFLYGEGVGSSRAPLVMTEFALRALRRVRRLKDLPIGIMLYGDEGRDCEESSALIRKAASRAGRILVLRPGSMGGKLVTGRRGQRRYRLTVEGDPIKLGKAGRTRDVMWALFPRLDQLSPLSSRKDRTAVAVVDMRTQAFPRLLPHRAIVTIQTSFPDAAHGDRLEEEIRAIFKGSRVRWDLTLVSDRPPMKKHRANSALLRSLKAMAETWEIPLSEETALWPSVAGLVPARVPVVCGLGPEAQDLYTSQEAVSRISLMQRTLLLAEFLLKPAG